MVSLVLIRNRGGYKITAVCRGDDTKNTVSLKIHRTAKTKGENKLTVTAVVQLENYTFEFTQTYKWHNLQIKRPSDCKNI